MLDPNKFKIVKIIVALKQLIETTTSEDYVNLTEAVKRVTHIANVMLNAKGVWFKNNKTIESIDFPLDFSATNNITDYFTGTTNLKTMVGFVSTRYIVYFNRAFNGSGIVSIQNPFDMSSAATSYATTFTQGAYYLEEIRFVRETIGSNMALKDNSRLSVESAKSILLGLKNYKGTNYEFYYTISFHNNTWVLLEAEGATAPGNITWEDYVTEIGWNK